MFDKLKNNNDEEVLEALHRFRENRTASTYSTMSGLVHEQLSDLLSLVTPTDTPLVARLARDRAVALTHYWIEQSHNTGAYTTLKYNEAGTPGDLAPATARKSNTVMTLGCFARVSNLVRKFLSVGGDPLARELAHNLEFLTKGIEYYLWNGTSGNSNEFSGVLEYIGASQTDGVSVATGALLEKDLQASITAIYKASGSRPTHIFCNPEVAYRIANFSADKLRFMDRTGIPGVSPDSMFYMSPYANIMEVVPTRTEFLASGKVCILTAPSVKIIHASDNLIDVTDIPENDADAHGVRLTSYLSLELRVPVRHRIISGVNSLAQ